MSSEYFKESRITGKKYDLFKQVRILNIQQAIFYLKNGVCLQDIEISKDRNGKNDVLVFLFDKDESQEAFQAWRGDSINGVSCNRR